MSALFIVLITLSAVGLYHAARLEGEIAGLKRNEERRRQQVEEQREWVRSHWPEENGDQGRVQCQVGD